MRTVSKIRISRLRELVDMCGSARNFCKRIQRSEAQVYQWLSETPDSKTGKPRVMGNASARRIEEIFGKPPGWMDQPIQRNVEREEADVQFVPLIRWEHLTKQEGNILYMEAFKKEECPYILCPESHGANTFALKVSGISMFNPLGGESFREGDLIFVDPDVKPSSGSFVVAKNTSTGDVFFRKYIAEGTRQFLYSLNTEWPDKITEVSGDVKILGTVIFSGRSHT